MTQEELAERAGISARTVSDVERGLRTLVHHDTARRLTSALGLGDEQRLGFEVLARGGPPGRPPLPTPSGLPTRLTPCLGRFKELEAIKGALLGGDVRLLTLTGPGGIGKTRLRRRGCARNRDVVRAWGVSRRCRSSYSEPSEGQSHGSQRRFVARQPKALCRLAAELAHHDGARAGSRTLNLGIKRLQAPCVRECQRVPGSAKRAPAPDAPVSPSVRDYQRVSA